MEILERTLYTSLRFVNLNAKYWILKYYKMSFAEEIQYKCHDVILKLELYRYHQRIILFGALFRFGDLGYFAALLPLSVSLYIHHEGCIGGWGNFMGVIMSMPMVVVIV